MLNSSVNNQIIGENNAAYHQHDIHRHVLKASLDFHFKIKDHIKSITVSLSLMLLVFAAVIAASVYFAIKFGVEADELKNEVKHLRKELKELNSSHRYTTTKAPNHISYQTCGIQESDRMSKRNQKHPKIVNGIPVKTHAWPWFVSIGVVNGVNSDTFCGGVLISKRHVLTAAHCLLDSVYEEYAPANYYKEINVERPSFESIIKVSIGNKERDQKNLYNVDKIILHPNFNETSFLNDIAMIKLEKEANESSEIRYICLDPLSRINVDDFVHVAGIGSINIDTKNKTFPKELMEIKIKVLDPEKCDLLNNDIYQFCAGNPSKSADKVQDSCAGDSGGPVIIRSNITNKWTLVGIVSFGNSSCDGYGVYTNVYKYFDWISENFGS